MMLASVNLYSNWDSWYRQLRDIWYSHKCIFLEIACGLMFISNCIYTWVCYMYSFKRFCIILEKEKLLKLLEFFMYFLPSKNYCSVSITEPGSQFCSKWLCSRASKQSYFMVKLLNYIVPQSSILTDISVFLIFFLSGYGSFSLLLFC